MRKVAFLVAVCCIAATACSDRPAATRLVGPSYQLLNPNCPTPTTIQNGIKAIFPSGGDRSSALSRFNQIVKEVDKGQAEAARGHAIQLVEFIVNKYEDGRLIGGQSITTQATLAQVLNGILCIVGLPQVFGPGSLGPDGAAAFIYPTTPDTTVVTGTEWAGVHIPAASVNQPTLVTIQRLPDFPGPLLTQLDQYPIYYEYHSTSASFTNDVLVGICLADNAVPPDPTRLRVAHNVPPYTMGSIEILPLATPSFLDCSDAPLASSASRWGFDLARAGDWIVRSVVAVIAPRPLMAMFGVGGVGGTVRTFSPFGVVDTLGVISPATPYPEVHAPTVGAVTSPTPSVYVKSPTGRPMVGVPVTFTVTRGGGSVTGGSTVTDANGQATVGSWTLGPVERRNDLLVTATGPARSGFADTGFEVPSTYLGFPRIWP